MLETRTALAATMAGDAQLMALARVEPIYRASAAMLSVADWLNAGELVCRISFFLVFGGEAPDVPFEEELFQLDYYSLDPDLNDRCAARNRDLLHKQPLVIPGRRFAYCLRVPGARDLAPDSRGVHHKVEQYRIGSYSN